MDFTMLLTPILSAVQGALLRQTGLEFIRAKGIQEGPLAGMPQQSCVDLGHGSLATLSVRVEPDIMRAREKDPARTPLSE